MLAGKGGGVPPPAPPTTGNSLTTRVQLAITAWLPEAKLGLHVVLFQGQRNGAQIVWHRSAETEHLSTPVADPRWMSTFVLDYHFEQVQPLRFVLMSGGVEIDELICDLATIVGSRGQTFVRQFQRSLGGLSIMAEEFRNQQAPTEKTITFSVCANHIEQNNLWSMMTDKPDPFLVITRMREDQTRFPVYQTEPHKKTLSPIWRPFEVSVDRLCAGSYDCPLQLEVYDAHLTQSPELLGQAQITMRQLLSSPGPHHITLIDKSTQKKKGVLEFRDIREKEVDNPNVQRRIATRGRYPPLYTAYSFLDFLSGGLELSMTFAIDYTVSNGLPSSEKSLHHLAAHGPNDYEKAIMAVGGIVANYSTDQFFPVFGFGGNPPGSDSVSHCFPVNGNAQRPEVQGLGGVIEAYRRSLQMVKLSAPTTFSRVIKAAADHAVKASANGVQKYHVLLILTDGVITTGNNTTFLDDTISEIVNASGAAPLSIIIVGIGAEDFTQMAVLDASDEPLHSPSGKVASRDCVMFVPFRIYENQDPSKLAADVLAELPDQILTWMAMTKQKPRPRVVVPPAQPGAMLAKPAPVPAANVSPALMRPSPTTNPNMGPPPPFTSAGNAMSPVGPAPMPGMMFYPSPPGGGPNNVMVAPSQPQQGAQPKLQRQPTGQVPEGFVPQQPSFFGGPLVPPPPPGPGWGMALVQSPNGPAWMPVPPGVQLPPGMQLFLPPGGPMMPSPMGSPMMPNVPSDTANNPNTNRSSSSGSVNSAASPSVSMANANPNVGMIQQPFPPNSGAMPMPGMVPMMMGPGGMMMMPTSATPPPYPNANQNQIANNPLPPSNNNFNVPSGAGVPPSGAQPQPTNPYSQLSQGPQSQPHPEQGPQAPVPPSLSVAHNNPRPVNPFDATPSAPPMVIPPATAPISSANPFDSPAERFNPFATVNVRHNVAVPERPPPVVVPSAPPMTAPPHVPASSPSMAPAQQQQSVDGPFSDQLRQLAQMGFSDTQRNVRLLQSKNGNVQSVIDELLRG